jgi:hypothetical protein
VIPDGYNFLSGDYWFDGNITLNAGSTCTINGTVRLFVIGTITIIGKIDGKGRGSPGAAFSANIYKGNDASPPGFFGNGGDSGIFINGPYAIAGSRGLGAKALFQATPIITAIGLQSTAGSWTSLGGIPIALQGSPGGSSPTYAYQMIISSEVGGNSGAGLLFMAKGIYISTGHIDLSGNPPIYSGTLPRNEYIPGGPGGGGSFVALAERDTNGLPVISINPLLINTSGCTAPPMYSGIHSNSLATATDSGSGTTITQVIG